MSVTRLREIIWIASGLLTVGLGWYVYDIVVVFNQAEPLYQKSEVERVLMDVADVTGPSRSLVRARLIEKTFFDFDWSGKPAPVVIDAPVVEPVAPGPVYTPIADILSVYYLEEDAQHADRSRAFVYYTSSSGVSGEVAVLGEVLHAGDPLQAPHESVTVESITLQEGVVFAFADGERPTESMRTEEFDTELIIPKVDPDSAMRPGIIAIPQGRRGVAWRPAQTTQIGSDTYQIGSQDATDLSENYAHVLANEVRHRRHRDPKTGKFDGVEIQSVTPGSIAARHGAAEGDVIKSINGHPVTSVSEAITFAKNHEGEYSAWEVVISNRGVERTVTYYSPSDG